MTLILLASLAAGVRYSIDYELKQRHQRQSVAPQYTYQADEQAREACAKETGLTEYRRCINEQAKTKREEGREYYDLGAQHDMALWTFTILWVSFVGLIATIFGIVLVAFTYRATKATLDETEEFNKHARENVRRELRAYLSVKPAGINILVGSTQVMGHVEICNVGKLPASEVTLVVRLTQILDDEKAVKKRFRPLQSPKPTTRVVQPGASMIMGSNRKDCLTLQSVVAGGYLFVWGAVQYKDGYGDPRTTRFCHRYHTASRDRSLTGSSFDPDRTLIDPDSARYHPWGNEAD